MRPIANQYCEGKVKSTPTRRVKEILKPCAYKRSELPCAVTACLLHNEPTSCRVRLVKGDDAPSHSESEAEEAVMSDVADAKPSDLHMSRMKSR